jgi:DNA primase small subunit
MPHSLPHEDKVTSDQDTWIEDGETQTADGIVTADSVLNNGESQFSDIMDQDLTMADAGVEGERVPEVAAKIEEKPEVKLEDLFADMESDEEIPSSIIQGANLSSSPEAPSSPV